MRATVVSLAETALAGTLSPHDFLGGLESCYLCGFTPANVEEPRRPNPRAVLLEMAPPDPRDPLLRSRRRCRNRSACENRLSWEALSATRRDPRRSAFREVPEGESASQAPVLTASRRSP